MQYQNIEDRHLLLLRFFLIRHDNVQEFCSAFDDLLPQLFHALFKLFLKPSDDLEAIDLPKKYLNIIYLNLLVIRENS